MHFKTSLLVALFLLTPTIALAGLTYQPLVGIPGVDNASSNFNQYINQLYFVSISIAALLAVIKIIIGGVKWMLTDVVTQKSDAKNDIRSALLGLLLIIAAVLILGTINPQLTNLNVLQSAPAVQLGQPQSPGTGTPEAPNNGTNPTWVAGQQERCETAGGTWSAPSAVFRNGNCTYPRGVMPPVQGGTPAQSAALTCPAGQVSRTADDGRAFCGFPDQNVQTNPNCPPNTAIITNGRCFSSSGDDITPAAAQPTSPSNEPAPDMTPAGA